MDMALSFPTEKVQGFDSDIFIPAALTGSAMNGDKVQVEITYRKAGRPRRRSRRRRDEAGARHHRRATAV